MPDLNFVSPGSGGTMTFARHRYSRSGERTDNITDWALNKFVAQYGRKSVTKDAIFSYVYAVLHDPVYRETYALNLRREFARIPFYAEFEEWSRLGEKLMSLHVGFGSVKPWPVKRVDTPQKRAKGTSPKPMLRSVADQGFVLVDEDTRITEISAKAWAYRLGNRSAIDWVLDQHKQKASRDAAIRENFDPYVFSDHKEDMIKLLAKVIRISVETVEITEGMRSISRE